MAKEEEAKKEHPPLEDEAPAEPKPRRTMLTFGLFGGIMVVEGLAIFVTMKFLGSNPDPTHGLEALQPTTQPWSETAEAEVAGLRVLNRTGPRSMLYSVRIVVTVPHAKQEAFDDFLKNRKSTVEDAMSRIIRSAEEKHLGEPGLETIRRQLRFELNALLGDDSIIEQVLIPEFTPLPAGF